MQIALGLFPLAVTERGSQGIADFGSERTLCGAVVSWFYTLSQGLVHARQVSGFLFVFASLSQHSLGVLDCEQTWALPFSVSCIARIAGVSPHTWGL